MTEEHGNIPGWLQWPEKEKPKDGILDESRKEMYIALSLFHSHVKYVIYIMITIPAAILAIMRFWPGAKPQPEFYLVAGIILIIVLPIGFISIRIIQRYYEVYVSALVFTTRLHIARDYAKLHPWLDRTIEQAKCVNNNTEFLRMRAKSGKDTFALYRWIIMILSIASGFGGIIFLMLGRCVLLKWLCERLLECS